MSGEEDPDVPTRARVLRLWEGLDDTNRRTWLAFGEFLRQRQGRGDHPASADDASQRPLDIPRPAEETTVAALKRLKRTYPMVDTDRGLLDEASRLVMRRVLGEEDRDVIDAMEALFAQRYRSWCATRGGGDAAGLPEK
ncbi:MAG: hypothetical protein H7831_10510 [Magnetococcus sp. WYHC-3]